LRTRACKGGIVAIARWIKIGSNIPEAENLLVLSLRKSSTVWSSFNFDFNFRLLFRSVSNLELMVAWYLMPRECGELVELSGNYFFAGIREEELYLSVEYLDLAKHGREPRERKSSCFARRVDISRIISSDSSDNAQLQPRRRSRLCRRRFNNAVTIT